MFNTGHGAPSWSIQIRLDKLEGTLWIRWEGFVYDNWVCWAAHHLHARLKYYYIARGIRKILHRAEWLECRGWIIWRQDIQMIQNVFELMHKKLWTPQKKSSLDLQVTKSSTSIGAYQLAVSGWVQVQLIAANGDCLSITILLSLNPKP